MVFYNLLLRENISQKPMCSKSKEIENTSTCTHTHVMETVFRKKCNALTGNNFFHCCHFGLHLWMPTSFYLQLRCFVDILQSIVNLRKSSYTSQKTKRKKKRFHISFCVLFYFIIFSCFHVSCTMFIFMFKEVSHIFLLFFKWQKDQRCAIVCIFRILYTHISKCRFFGLCQREKGKFIRPIWIANTNSNSFFSFLFRPNYKIFSPRNSLNANVNCVWMCVCVVVASF